MNAKSIILILSMTILITCIIFLVAIVQEGVGPDLLNGINDQVPKIISDPAQQAELAQRIDQYSDNKINYDYIFMAGFVALESIAIALAINSPKLPNLSFMSFLFFGSAMLLFIYPLFMQINSYFYNNLLLGIFTDTVFIMPMYNWFMNSQLFVIIANIILLLGLNKVFGNVDEDIIVSDGGIGQ